MNKLLLVSDIMSGRGGTELVVAKTIQMLKNHYGVEPTIFLHGNDRSSHFEWQRDVDHQIEFTTVRNHKLQQLQTAWRLAKKIKQYKPDCIIAIAPISIYISHLARIFSRSKTRIISWSHINIDYKVIGPSILLAWGKISHSVSSMLTNWVSLTTSLGMAGSKIHGRMLPLG